MCVYKSLCIIADIRNSIYLATYSETENVNLKYSTSQLLRTLLHVIVLALVEINIFCGIHD